MKLTVDNITPCTMIRNEEFFIHYVIRDMLKVFGKIVVLDTGSTDATIEIVKETARLVGGYITLIEENYGNDDKKIGNGRNVLREACPTYWELIFDGDEVWREDKLHKIFAYEVEDHVDVVMLAGWNVEDVDGKLMLRTNDLANRDGLFSPKIKWSSLAYPFEGYGLVENYIEKGKGLYLPAREIYAYHCRHTLRSSKNWDAYFRKDKLGFYKYSGPWEELPSDWLGEINPNFFNPYLTPTQVRQS